MVPNTVFQTSSEILWSLSDHSTTTYLNDRKAIYVREHSKEKLMATRMRQNDTLATHRHS